MVKSYIETEPDSELSRRAEDALQHAAEDGKVIVLLYLIEAVSRGSSKSRSDYDYIKWSIQEVSVGMVLTTITSSKVFPVATVNWVDHFALRHEELKFTPRNENELSYDQKMELIYVQLKDWWAHNQTAIRAKQYDRATWVPQDSAALLAFLAAAKSPPGASPPVSADPFSPTTSLAATPPAPALWFAGSVALLAALALGWRILRRK